MSVLSVRLSSLLMFLLPFGLKTASSFDATVDYYEKIINDTIENATFYQPPEKNSELDFNINQNITQDFGSFDFIIIGAGSAGSVLATRLSEIETWKILLIEAGGEEDDITDIPAMQPHVMQSERAWFYKSAPQKHFCSLDPDNRCPIYRGKILGGTSTINGVHYVRGNARDFENWGYNEWTYDKVLPYFIKPENSQVDGDEGFHGKDGYLNIEYQEPELELLSSFFDANNELGINKLDVNGRTQNGTQRTPHTTKNGKRHSTGRAFLSYARRRSNLKVTTKSFVTEINFDQNLRAIGVNFVKDGILFRATAKNEIILSAGALNSPQILMLSGIGPRKDLEKLGIQVIHDLPSVGQNMIDHIGVALTFKINQTLEKLDMRTKIEQYIQGFGPLTKTASSDAVAVYSTTENEAQKYIISYVVKDDNTISLSALVCHTKSRGSISLKSSNPNDFPNIDPNLFSDNEDREDLYRAVEILFKYSKTRAFQRLNATFIDQSQSCGPFQETSKEFWDCHFKQNNPPIAHSIGTTRIGSVVNTDLKVFGVKGLRVVDAGVIPNSMTAHINGIVVMIGEKMADRIKEENGKLKGRSNASFKSINTLLLVFICIIGNSL